MELQIPERFDDVLRVPDVQVQRLADDGTFPNNDALPVLVLRQAFRLASQRDPASTMERVFQAHNWHGTWRNGIFSYHHYHSTTHEVLGVSRGGARVQLGGPQGEVFSVEAGDVLVLPAGVAHKNLGAEGRFQVVGAYPEGRDWDLKRGDPSDRPEADKNIDAVPLPDEDPVYGANGPLLMHWKEAA